MSKPNCSKCSKKPLSGQWPMLLLAIYILGTAIYGNIVLFKYLFIKFNYLFN